MSTSKFTFICLLWLLLFTLVSCSPTPDPETAIEAWNAAVNDGDVEAALEYLDEGATVTIVPPPPGMSGVFTGKEQIRAWYEGNIAQNGYNEFTDIQVDGETVSWTSNFGMDEWRNLGIESLVTHGEGIMVDGKFLSYTVTIPPESLAKLPPPPGSESE